MLRYRTSGAFDRGNEKLWLAYISPPVEKKNNKQKAYQDVGRVVAGLNLVV